MTQVIPTPQTLNPPSERALMDAFKRDIMKDINCARIGTIVSYDPGVAGQRPPTATVQIAQRIVTSVAFDGTETYADYPPLELVPVIFVGGGGYSITWPVAAGDECLLIFHDRELDNWFTNGAGFPPTTGRLHDYSDAVCIVGLKSGPNALANVSADTVQIRSDDYTGPTGAGECVEISPGKIGLYADEVIVHGRNKTTFDAGGTGFVYTPNDIETYTDGVGGGHHFPNPPIVPT